MKVKSFHIISLLWFLSLFPLSAQDLSKLTFDRLTVEEGLNNSIVYTMIQDDDGIMWFGLHDGIDRYNGYDFQQYNLEEEPGGQSKYNSQVRTIFQTSREEFWIGSVRNIFRYDIQKDKFELIIEDLSSNQLVNQIQALYISRDSILYIGTNMGLFSYEIRSKVLFDHTMETNSTISLHYIDGMLWVGTGSGIRFFDTATGEYVDPDPSGRNKNLFSSVNALCFYTDSIDHFTLIGTRTSGLYYYDHRSQELREITDDGKRFLNIRVINRYDSNYLIGMDGYGLAIIDKDFKLLHKYAHDEDSGTSLSNNGIYDILVDTDKRIWICTYGGGINVYDPNKKPFHVLKHEQNIRNSLRNNVSRSFLEQQERMIFGTAKGLSILSNTGTWWHVPPLKSQEESNIILAMCKDSKGQIWLGTFNGGVEVRNRVGQENMVLRKNGGDGPALSTDYIYAIIEDSRKNIWMGGIRGGLMVLNSTSNQISVFNSIQNVHSIIENSEKDIMVGTLEGIRILSYSEGSFSLNTEMDTLLTNLEVRVFAILQTQPGEFWIGTEGSGLFYYNRLKGEIKQYSTSNGLPSNIVYGVLEDNNSNIWVSTTSGLAQLDPQNEKFSVYDVADGISGKNFNYGAYYKASDGTLYFGSQEGVTYFKPEQIQKNNTQANIVLTGVSILGMDKQDPENPVHNLNINETTVLELNHHHNSFTIEYAAINYTGTKKNKYQWKISGGEFGEGSWTPVSTERNAVFSYLPPGNYKFSVKASNNDDVWNETGRSLDIIVKPPIWKTQFAKIVYILLVVLIFIAIQRSIFTFVRGKQAKEKIQFFINIAHDIRTPLTLITAPMSKLVNSNKLSWEEKEEVRVAVKNSNRLKILLNQLLEFQKASLHKQVLKVSEYDVVSLVNEVFSNFQPLMDERLINVKTEFSSKSINAWFDRQKIEKILYNLISNAIKYSHKGGSILIRVETHKRKVIISVKDDGRGIPSKQQREIFKRYFRAQNAINTRETGSGVGLMLSKKLIELHKGEISFSSTENVGSQFVISFPMDRKSYKSEEVTVGDIQEEIKHDPEEIGEITFSQEYTILVVEDNTELRHHIRNQLAKDYNILTARNGKMAYESIIKLEVDLIISDVMMPEMDGRELCQKVRNNIATSHIPIILLTALNSMEDKIEGLEYGADDYIEKPFDIEHLKIRIANLLKARERFRERFLDKPDQPEAKSITSKPDQELMLKLNEITREKVLQEEFSVKEMCRLVGMSRPVLYRKLKAYTGHSPQDYIIILRLNHASRLLKEGGLSIKEIAYNSGFSDPKYFSKSFKKLYGVSPSSYLESSSGIRG